ncbi:hypothetical protein [Archangium sp.]|uniref:hypothetical protein n=1 Tax=Archangium sp. TaxID=1872627 RepID=UPI002D6BCF9C|nr:hypothetical protein [Archangium sp.]HYO54473.1 hypothetical protein [Archangium sp.]
MSQSAEQIRSKMESILSKMSGDSAFEQSLRSDAAGTLSELGLRPDALAGGEKYNDCAGLFSCLLLTAIIQ